MTSVVELFKKIGAYLDSDHFVYSSGRHGEIYLNKNDLFAYTDVLEQANRMLAMQFGEAEVDTVLGVAMCGILPARGVAQHLSQIKGKTIHNVFAEKDANKQFFLGRGYEKFVKGKKVLIVDDIATSGSTARKAIELVKRLGGEVIAFAVFVNRNPQEVSTSFLGAPFVALDSVQIPSYAADDCPLCRAGKPINTSVGHGKK